MSSICELPRYHWRPHSRWRGARRPELDPIELLDGDALGLMMREAERRIEPNQILSYLFTQLEPLLRLPSRLGQAVDRLETGTLKVG